MTVCLGDEPGTQHCEVLDTDAFDIVTGTGFLRRNPQLKLFPLQRPYALHCDFSSGLIFFPLDLSGREESGLRYVNAFIELNTISWCRLSSKMGWPSCR